MDKNTIRVLVGSKNPTKTNAVKDAFVEVFPKNNILVFGEAAPSLVSDQPMSNKETLAGAENRVGCLLKKRSDYYVGIEGGCVVRNNKMFAFAWVVTKDKTKKGVGKTSLFQLPKEIQRLVLKGVELGVADDVVFERTNSKKKDGAVGILTHGIINRTKYYKEAVIMSLIPFVNKELSF